MSLELARVDVKKRQSLCNNVVPIVASVAACIGILKEKINENSILLVFEGWGG